MTPTTHRRLLLIALVLLAALPFLTGCAAPGEDLLAGAGTEHWLPVPVRPAAKVVKTEHVSDPEELAAYCHVQTHGILWGCAKFITPEICVIYHAQPVMSRDVETHERRHCAGYIHH